MTQQVQTGGVTAGPAAMETITGGLPGSGRTFVTGSVGQKLLGANFDINVLRPCAEAMSNGLAVNGTLLYDEWKAFDDVVQQVSRERLPCTADLMARGLMMQLPNALGVLDLQWERVRGDLADAEISMSGLVESTKDRMEFETLNMPIPVYHKDFYYNLRHITAARRNGHALDTSHAMIATRKIAELVERTLFTGVSVGSGNIYGYLTEPNRKTATVTASWLTATGEQIVADIIRFIDILTNVGNNFEGPFQLYVSQTVGARFGNDYKDHSDKTIMQRIMEIPGISGIQWTSRLTGTNLVLAQMTSDVVEIINGIQPTMVEWDSHGGWQHNFKIIAIMPPRVRSDGWQQSGILHAS